MVEKQISDPSNFTGIGRVRLMDGSQVMFKIAVPQRTIRYDLIVRYNYEVSSSDYICCHCNCSSMFSVFLLWLG